MQFGVVPNSFGTLANRVRLRRLLRRAEQEDAHSWWLYNHVSLAALRLHLYST